MTRLLTVAFIAGMSMVGFPVLGQDIEPADDAAAAQEQVEDLIGGVPRELACSFEARVEARPDRRRVLEAWMEINEASARLAARTKGLLIHGVRDQPAGGLPDGTHVFADGYRYSDNCLSLEFSGDVVVEAWGQGTLLSRLRMDGMTLELTR